MRTVRGLVVAVLGLAWLLATPATADAVSLSTRYPGIDVRPGDRITLPLQVSSSRAEVVALDVAAAPEGWDASFRGGGFTVHRVFAEPGDPAGVDLQVTVPSGVKPGDYEVVVRATAASGTSTLPLLLRVNPSAAGRAELTAEYPVLQGASGAVFEYRLELRNDSSEKRLFTLAADAPEGWVVKIQPAFSTKETTSIPVEPGATESIDVRVETPDRVEAGRYTIVVRASAPGVTASTELAAVVTGTYQLDIQTPDERFSTRATAGRETPLRLLLVNNGTAPVHNVKLDAFEPSGWTVEFRPESVEVVPPGESREVTALIKPKNRALAGDYVLTINADGQEDSDNAEFRVSVTTPTTWGLVGVVLVFAALAGTGYVFRTYGRR